MQMTEQNKLESIFQKALDVDEGSREDFLDDACGDDASLRGEVDRLLRAHAVVGSFLHGQSPNFRATELQLRATSKARVYGPIIT